MRIAPRHLLNTSDVEIWPAHLLRARANATARRLAQATHVVRDKRDGRFLAAAGADHLVSLTQDARLGRGMRDVLARLASDPRTAPSERALPLTGIERRLHALGLDAGYAERTGLALVAEPASLTLAGRDRYRRPLWLRRCAARAWRLMQEGARAEGIVLEAISGYRSHDYQLAIFERKRARGQSLEEILQVNAAPGFSEHHSGLALDISTPGEPAAEESFECSDAFGWLRANAGAYGFTMSYPRDNPHGIVYEPWHWRHTG